MLKTVGKHRDDYEQYQIVAGFSKILNSKAVLEVGCGYSRFKPLFAKYTGIDVNPDVSPDHVMDTKDLGFPSDSFDLVLSCTCLMHIEDIEPALQEIARVSSKHILLIETGKKLKTAYNHIYKFSGFQKILELKLTTPRSPLKVWLFTK